MRARVQRLFGAVVLGNLAVNPACAAELMEGYRGEAGATVYRGLAAVAAVVGGADLETARAGSFVFANLTAAPAHRPTLVGFPGALAAIIALGCSDTTTDQQTSMRALRALASSPEAREPLVAAGVLESIHLSVTAARDTLVLRDAAACARALALAERNKLAIAVDRLFMGTKCEV